jgi:uncharacterized protein (DUF1330 family)
MISQTSAARYVVIEIPSREQAQVWCDSAEYQSILLLRLKISTAQVVLVDGMD